MKETTTRTKEVWAVCTCGGNKECFICKGIGRFISETLTETVIRVTTVIEDDVVEAEEVAPELENA